MFGCSYSVIIFSSGTFNFVNLTCVIMKVADIFNIFYYMKSFRRDINSAPELNRTMKKARLEM